MSEHSLVLDIVIRLLRLLGCPHACGEKMVQLVIVIVIVIVIFFKTFNSSTKVWGSAEFLRGQCIALLTRLLWTDKKQFKWSVARPHPQNISISGSSPTWWSSAPSTSSSTSSTPTSASAPSSPTRSPRASRTPTGKPAPQLTIITPSWQRSW